MKKQKRTKLPSPLLVIGGGRMGSALIAGWVAAGVRASSVHVVEKDAKRRTALAKQGYKAHAKLPDIDPAVTLLAIKPQGFADFSKEFGTWYRKQSAHPVISIVTGITIARLQSALGNKAPVIRAMPNTPALIGEGVTGIAMSKGALMHGLMATDLLGVVGDVIVCADEAMIDAITGLSGSGPAYVFHFLEVLVAAGIEQGLPEDIAKALAIQTVRGAVLLAESEGAPLASLRENVTSPGGTTEAALKVLMPKQTPLVKQAVKAAIKRAKQLAKA